MTCTIKISKTWVSSLTVANYILCRFGKINFLKLHKLLYYCQAWHLVWTESPLFYDEIEAWRSGPVVPRVWKRHKDLLDVSSSDIQGIPGEKITKEQKETIDIICGLYSGKKNIELRDMVRGESPWKYASKGFRTKNPTENDYAEIPLSAMQCYYFNQYKRY